MSDLTEEEIHNHQKIVEHNSQFVNDDDVVYPEDKLIEEFASALYDVPIKYDLATGAYYQVVEFEEGEEIVVLDKKYYDIINHFVS